MLYKKHYKIFNRFVILELLSLCEFNISFLLLFQKLVFNAFISVVYWKLNILRYLCPLLFPRPKILVVLFRNDDKTWGLKGDKRTSENRRKINGLEASKNWDEWNFFSRAMEISRQLCPLRGNENWFELAGVRVIEGSTYRG